MMDKRVVLPRYLATYASPFRQPAWFAYVFYNICSYNYV
jgi:hypothetical protein